MLLCQLYPLLSECEMLIDMTNGNFVSDGLQSALVGTGSQGRGCERFAKSALIGWIMIASLAA